MQRCTHHAGRGAPAQRSAASRGSCTRTPCDTPPNRIFLFDVANGSVFVRPDETIRLVAIDVGGTLVVIVPRATADGAADETIYRQLVAPVLASMHFEPRP